MPLLRNTPKEIILKVFILQVQVPKPNYQTYLPKSSLELSLLMRNSEWEFHEDWSGQSEARNEFKRPMRGKNFVSKKEGSLGTFGLSKTGAVVVS